MRPNVHARILFIINVSMYIGMFLGIYFLYKSGLIERDQALPSFIAALAGVYVLDLVFRRVIVATCPKCDNPCRTVGRKPVYYQCTFCDYSLKSTLSQGETDPHDKR